MEDITILLQAMNRREPEAADRLMRAVYSELRRLASARLSREQGPQTLQPTALVHDVWLRLGGDHQTAWENRRHFFSAAAEAMRRILIDRVRRRQRMRHGGGEPLLNIDEFEVPAEQAKNLHLLAINEALERLAREEPERAELVKLRYFAGLTLEEAAATLGISLATAKRWWAFARAWLFREIRG